MEEEASGPSDSGTLADEFEMLNVAEGSTTRSWPAFKLRDVTPATRKNERENVTGNGRKGMMMI